MECNKDEAVRAQEIAKMKFLANDISGAKKFALKAQNLYPELEGISQMIATFNILLSAKKKINGEIDWYAVLGVNPGANDETVRKQYRKLAVVLHPDKNKSVGAEAAFKYLSQAWSLFSDKAKRVEYDQQRNAELYQRVSTTSGGSNPAMNGFHNSTKTSGNTSKVKSSKRVTTRVGDTAAHASSSHKPKPDGTFWTICHNCRTQYEYLRIYLNHNLLCPNCHEAFLAIETAPPGSGSIRRSYSEHQWNSNAQAFGKNRNGSGRDNGVFGNLDPYSQANFQWSVFSGAENAVHAAQVGSRIRKNSKRMSGVSSTTIAAKRRRGMENTGVTNITSSHMGRGAGGNSLFNSLTTKSSGTKDVSHLDLRNLLTKKVKREISKKIQESNNNAGAEIAAERRIEGEKDDVGSEISLAKKEACCESNGKSESYCINPVCSTSSINTDSKFLEALITDVPESDVCDFDKDRTEKSFGDNQVWAAYDDFDGMPRCYAMIHNVVSLDPFRLRISWLAPKTNGEFSSLNWLDSGLKKICGDFRVGKREIYRSLNSFSHKVNWTRASQGEIRIYPRKGDVWALYRNWSPDWNFLKESETTHKYEIVEVIEGYSEDFGASVVPLVKVAGFKAVFHHHLDPREVRTIPREEIARFSHQIPSYLLTGQEAFDSLKGCRELDPAATPFEFLRVIVHGKVEDFTEQEKVTEMSLGNYINLEEANDKMILDDAEKAIQVKEEKPEDCGEAVDDTEKSIQEEEKPVDSREIVNDTGKTILEKEEKPQDSGEVVIPMNTRETEEDKMES